MIGEIKVLTVGGKNYPISDKLYGLLSADAEIEAEVSRIIADGTVKTRKTGKGKK
jgi:hypothetical protein